MSPKHSNERPTTGELEIMFQGLEKSIDDKFQVTNETISRISEAITASSEAIKALNEDRAERRGAIRLIAWLGGSIITALFALSWFGINQMFENSEMRIQKSFDLQMKEHTKETLKMVDDKFQKEFEIHDMHV
jgi:plasmid maintenance system antidote protein VapI